MNQPDLKTAARKLPWGDSYAWDVTRPLEESMAVYKNRDTKLFRRRVDADYSTRGFRETSITQWNLHTGTHVDAPLHMLEGGDTIDHAELPRFLGPALLLDLTGVEEVISAADLEAALFAQGGTFRSLAGLRVLLRTRNSLEDGYNPRFVYLSVEGARWLVERGISLLGIDAMSVERDQPTHPAHDALLGAGVPIVEDLRLAGVPEGRYTFVGLPMLLVGGEASPLRAILLPPSCGLSC